MNFIFANITLKSSLDFLISVFSLTIYQVCSLLGVVFILGFILYKLEKATTQCIYRFSGWYGVLFTAWLGTPLHEFGHLIFCWLFGHSVTEVKLFKPDTQSGTLGYVNHSYNPKNVYHQIGNMFIGLGPFVTGYIALYLIVRFLFPGAKDILFIFNSGANIASSDISSVGTLFINNSIAVIKVLFRYDNFKIWQFWLFVYLSLCVTSHMAPSTPDLKHASKGFLTVFFLLLLTNMIFLALGKDLNTYINFLASQTGKVFGFMILGIILSGINFIFTYLISLVLAKNT